MYNMKHMPYTQNPYLPRVRMQAVRLVQGGWGKRKVARYLGVHHSAVIKWCRKAEWLPQNAHIIPTASSRPHTHPHSLDRGLVRRIVTLRQERGRCAEVVHRQMVNEGREVSLSSVKRTLDRQGLIKKRSPWKRYHEHMYRPEAACAGDLVEIDTIHIGSWHPERLYVYTLIDVYSRWAWAEVLLGINTHRSIRFVDHARDEAPFQFATLQSDHGQEFSTYFTEHMGVQGMRHRHTRLRKPNDNAHVERFNRTIQEECLDGVPRTLNAYQKAISDYLPYYNNERLHLGIELQTPNKWCQGID